MNWLKRLRLFGRQALNKLLAVRPVHSLARYLAERGVIPEAVWSGYPIHEVVQLEIAGTRFSYEVHSGDYVGMPLYWCGSSGFEPETVDLFVNLISEVETFFDVGANTGFYSLIAALQNPHLEVFAFEPAADTFAQLERNIRLNALQDRVTSVRAALGARPGPARLFVPDGVFATSATLSPTGMERLSHRLEDICVDTVDNFCRAHPVPDLIKIDVEGTEDAVLRGMVETICNVRPTLIVECLADGPVALVEELLRKHGYRFALIDGGTIAWRNHIAPEPGSRHRNWLCAVEY